MVSSDKNKMDNHSQIIREHIRETFLCMFNEADVEGITVKALAKKAGVSRATFYRYYNSVYDVLEDATEYYLGFKTKRTPSIHDERFDEIVREETIFMAQSIKNHPKLYFRMLADDKQFDRAYVDHILEREHDYSLAVVYEHEKIRNKSSVPPKYVSAMMGGSANWILIRWAKEGFIETPEEIADIILKSSMSIVTGILGDTQSQ